MKSSVQTAVAMEISYHFKKNKIYETKNLRCHYANGNEP